MTLQNVYKCITIDEVIELLNEYKDEAKIIAGGTDVIVAMMAGKLSPKGLIDVSSIEELREIKETADEIEENMPLIINPVPDTVIRIVMNFKGLDTPIKVEDQKLRTPERNGFTVVEWGGTEIK